MQTLALPTEPGNSPHAWDKTIKGLPKYTIDRAVEFFSEETNVPGLLLLDDTEAKISPQRRKVHKDRRLSIPGLYLRLDFSESGSLW
jgi:hypothetical protein